MRYHIRANSENKRWRHVVVHISRHPILGHQSFISRSRVLLIRLLPSFAYMVYPMLQSNFQYISVVSRIRPKTQMKEVTGPSLFTSPKTITEEGNIRLFSGIYSVHFLTQVVTWNMPDSSGSFNLFSNRFICCHSELLRYRQHMSAGGFQLPPNNFQRLPNSFATGDTSQLEVSNSFQLLPNSFRTPSLQATHLSWRLSTPIELLPNPPELLPTPS